MSIEPFYEMASDADYLIYNGSIDSSVNTLDNLINKDPIMSEFKAVQDGNCWVSGSSLYQRIDIIGDIILDFHTLFTEDEPDADLEYLTRLK